MVLPSKHVNFSESLLGFGSYLLEKLKEPLSIDDIWRLYKYDLHKELYHARQTFDNLILALIFLFNVKAIYEENGLIYKCS